MKWLKEQRDLDLIEIVLIILIILTIGFILIGVISVVDIFNNYKSNQYLTKTLNIDSRYEIKSVSETIDGGSGYIPIYTIDKETKEHVLFLYSNRDKEVKLIHKIIISNK